MHAVIEVWSQYSPGMAGTGTRKHSPNYLNLCCLQLRQFVTYCLDKISEHGILSVCVPSYLFSSRPLRKGLTLTHSWNRTRFALPFSKGSWGGNIQPKCKSLESCSCSFTRHNPNPGKKSGILPSTSKRCSSTPTPCQGRRAPCHHTAALCPHISQRESCRFFPHYQDTHELTAEQAGLSETTSHWNTQRGTRRDGQAPPLTAQALADYKLLETKH